MNRIILISPILTVTALVFAVQGRINLQDKAGNMEVRGGTSFIIEAIENSSKVKFIGKGNPIVAEWKKDGMLVESQNLEAIADRPAVGRYNVESAILQGAVHAKQKTNAQLVEIWSNDANYTASNETWDLNGNVRVEQSDSVKGTSSKMSGTKGTIVLYARGEKTSPRGRIKTANVTGPVTFEVHSKRMVQVSSNPPKSELKPTVVTGKADRMDFDNVQGTVTLTGNVFISGDDPVVPGDMEATKATVFLDETGGVKRIELEGEPGVTRLKRPAKGKRGGEAR